MVGRPPRSWGPLWGRRPRWPAYRCSGSGTRASRADQGVRPTNSLEGGSPVPLVELVEWQNGLGPWMCETESVRSFSLARPLPPVLRRRLRARRPAVRSRGLVGVARPLRTADQRGGHFRGLRGKLESARWRPHLLQSVDRVDRLRRPAAPPDRRAVARHVALIDR